MMIYDDDNDDIAFSHFHSVLFLPDTMMMMMMIFILMMMITMMILLFMMLHRRFETTLKLKQHVVFCFQRLNVELNHPQTLSDLFSALQRSAGVSTLIFQTFIAFSSSPF